MNTPQGKGYFTQTDLEHKADKVFEFIFENHATAFEDQRRILEIALQRVRNLEAQKAARGTVSHSNPYAPTHVARYAQKPYGGTHGG